MRTTFVSKSCDFRGEAEEVYFVYYFRTEKLRLQGGLRKYTLRTTFVLRSCGFRAGAAKVHFVHYLCDECSENSPRKFRDGVKDFFSRRRRFPEQGFSATVMCQNRGNPNIHIHIYIYTHMCIYIYVFVVCIQNRTPWELW